MGKNQQLAVPQSISKLNCFKNTCLHMASHQKSDMGLNFIIGSESLVVLSGMTFAYTSRLARMQVTLIIASQCFLRETT